MGEVDEWWAERVFSGDEDTPLHERADVLFVSPNPPGTTVYRVEEEALGILLEEISLEGMLSLAHLDVEWDAPWPPADLWLVGIGDVGDFPLLLKCGVRRNVDGVDSIPLDGHEWMVLSLVGSEGPGVVPVVISCPYECEQGCVDGRSSDVALGLIQLKSAVVATLVTDLLASDEQPDVSWSGWGTGRPGSDRGRS